MGKRTSSVLDMAREVTDDDAFVGRLGGAIASNSVGKDLLSARCAMGMSEEDVARSIGCSPEDVCRLEHTPNAELKMCDLAAYAKALRMKMEVIFSKMPMTAVDNVKYHTFEIKKHLDRLAELAQKDERIKKGVTEFFAEYLFNSLAFFCDSASKLKPVEPEELAGIHVVSQVDIPEGESALASSG